MRLHHLRCLILDTEDKARDQKPDLEEVDLHLEVARVLNEALDNFYKDKPRPSEEWDGGI